MFTKLYWHREVCKGLKAQDIWGLWADVNNYLRWHNGLDYCKLEGDFVVGNYFTLKPKGAPPFKIFITELIKNRRFVDCTYFFGAKMYDIHELEETPEGLRVTNTLKITGVLSFFWDWLIARKVAAAVPHKMEALIGLARKKYE